MPNIEKAVQEIFFAAPGDGDFGCFTSDNKDYKAAFGNVAEELIDKTGVTPIGFATTEGFSITLPEGGEVTAFLTFGQKRRRSRTAASEDGIVATFTLANLLSPDAWKLAYETEVDGDGNLVSVNLMKPVKGIKSICVDLVDEETGKIARLIGRGTISISGDWTASDEDASTVTVTLNFSDAAEIVSGVIAETPAPDPNPGD